MRFENLHVFHVLLLKKNKGFFLEDGEMARQLRALAAPAEESYINIRLPYFGGEEIIANNV